MKKTICLLISTLILSACAPNYSEGTRIGVVTKLSYKGLFWKSWEGTLNQGGTKIESDGQGNSQVVANAIDFNVSDPEVIEQLKSAASSGSRVEIHYNEWFMPPLSIVNDHVVDSVKELK